MMRFSCPSFFYTHHLPPLTHSSAFCHHPSSTWPRVGKHCVITGGWRIGGWLGFSSKTVSRAIKPWLVFSSFSLTLFSSAIHSLIVVNKPFVWGRFRWPRYRPINQLVHTWDRSSAASASCPPSTHLSVCTQSESGNTNISDVTSPILNKNALVNIFFFDKQQLRTYDQTCTNVTSSSLAATGNQSRPSTFVSCSQSF